MQLIGIFKSQTLNYGELMATDEDLVKHTHTQARIYKIV